MNFHFPSIKNTEFFRLVSGVAQPLAAIIVILSAAKDLFVKHGEKQILRFAQNDRFRKVCQKNNKLRWQPTNQKAFYRLFEQPAEQLRRREFAPHSLRKIQAVAESAAPIPRSCFCRDIPGFTHLSSIHVGSASGQRV